MSASPLSSISNGETVFKADHTASYKQVIDFDSKKKKNFLSFDTGVSGNLLGGHYFDMNEDHLQGKLKTQETDFDQMVGNQYFKADIMVNGSDQSGD